MRVYAIILNWHGWADTLDCLDSVLRSDYSELRVVVCDNGSTDDSLERIRAGAADRRLGRVAEYSRAEAEAGGDMSRDPPLVLVRNGENLGYAGGCNVGIRYALARGDASFVWLLNNDTVVRPDALSALVRRVQADPEIGLCGSLLLYHDAPDVIQAVGGFRYNRWLGTSRQLYQFEPASIVSRLDERSVSRQIFGVQGASVLATRRFLDDVGLLSEDYFLYFEEQDWAARAERRGFRRAVALDSVVYHKEGASTGGRSAEAAARSALSDYYSIRSRLHFTRKMYPYALPTVYLGLIGVVLNRMRRGQRDRIRPILELAARGLRGWERVPHSPPRS